MEFRDFVVVETDRRRQRARTRCLRTIFLKHGSVATNQFHGLHQRTPTTCADAPCKCHRNRTCNMMHGGDVGLRSVAFTRRVSTSTSTHISRTHTSHIKLLHQDADADRRNTMLHLYSIPGWFSSLVVEHWCCNVSCVVPVTKVSL